MLLNLISGTDNIVYVGDYGKVSRISYTIYILYGSYYDSACRELCKINVNEYVNQNEISFADAGVYGKAIRKSPR
ncbi:MAG: hypothetical protein ACXAAI_12210 [Promethearchaeota archaeon]